jgi:hypothetical protein
VPIDYGTQEVPAMIATIIPGGIRSLAILADVERAFGLEKLYAVIEGPTNPFQDAFFTVRWSDRADRMNSLAEFRILVKATQR